MCNVTKLIIPPLYGSFSCTGITEKNTVLTLLNTDTTERKITSENDYIWRKLFPGVCRFNAYTI